MQENSNFAIYSEEQVAYNFDNVVTVKLKEADGSVTEIKSNILAIQSQFISRMNSIKESPIDQITDSNPDFFFVQNSVLNMYGRGKGPLILKDTKGV